MCYYYYHAELAKARSGLVGPVRESKHKRRETLTELAEAKLATKSDQEARQILAKLIGASLWLYVQSGEERGERREKRGEGRERL